MIFDFEFCCAHKKVLEKKIYLAMSGVYFHYNFLFFYLLKWTLTLLIPWMMGKPKIGDLTNLSNQAIATAQDGEYPDIIRATSRRVIAFSRRKYKRKLA